MRQLWGMCVLLACIGPACGQMGAKQPIQLDDYASLAAITDLTLSSDGKWIAYSEARWSKGEDNRRTDLWIVPSNGKESPQRLTSDRANDRHPRFNEDGQGVYVLGNRKREADKKAPYDGTTQVWYIPLQGGEAKPLTQIEGGVDGFDYSPTDNALFVAVSHSTTDVDDFTALRSKHTKAEYGHGTRKTSAIYRLDLNTWRLTTHVKLDRYVREFAVAPDGRKIGMITAPDDTVITSEGRARIEVFDRGVGRIVTADESWRKSAASPYPWLEGLTWSGDSKQLAFCSIFDAYPAEIIQHTQEGSQWTAKRVARPKNLHVRGYGAALAYAGTTLLFTREQQGSIDVVPAVPEVLEKIAKEPLPDRVVYSLAVSRDGQTMAMVASDSTQMPELFAGPMKEGGTLKRLTTLNPQARDWAKPQVTHVTWKAPDGTMVGGVLELPPDYKKGTKLPLVVALHGGPTTASKKELSFDPHNGRLYFAVNGYAVLLPNYRGSTGYGDSFVTDLVGQENDIEVKDILAGIKHLVQEGIADPNRVGVMGWSNGGYLTNCLITLKDSPIKFKAASSGAGILDSVAEWGFNDEPAYPIVFKKGLPWETPEIYRKTSPTYGLGNATTPTIIHVGGGDERCPPGHSRMLYRALKEYNKVPTELIVYTGEPHGLTKLSNRLAKMEWDLAWFKKYLK